LSLSKSLQLISNWLIDNGDTAHNGLMMVQRIWKGKGTVIIDTMDDDEHPLRLRIPKWHVCPWTYQKSGISLSIHQEVQHQCENENKFHNIQSIQLRPS
jgi:hypothetical protein